MDGGRAGLLLSANTLGAIVGTFVVPFAVIPLIGSPAALGLIAILNASLAVILALRGGLVQRLGRAAVAAVGSGVVVLLAVAIGVGGFFVGPSIARIERISAMGIQSAEDESASVQGGAKVDKNGTDAPSGDWHGDDPCSRFDAGWMPILP